MAEANPARARIIPAVLFDRRLARCLVVAAGCLVLANCSSSNMNGGLGVPASPKVVPDGQPVPKGGGRTMTGKPYVVGGRTYRPMKDPEGYSAVGTASWYGHAFRGRYTSNHEIFDGAALSAAHPTLPLPSYVRVTNLDNGRSVVVRVNDRGPFHGHRLIDVSKKTAEVLGFRRNGTAKVRVRYVGPASLAGSDDRKLLATYEVNGRPARPNMALAENFPPPPRKSGAPALLAALNPAPPERPDETARRAPAAVPLPAPPPTRLAALPAREPIAHAPARIARDDLMPARANDPIGRLVAEGHPPMPEPRRVAYATGIEPAPSWPRAEPSRSHRGVVAAARTPAGPAPSPTAARHVRDGFSGYREPIPLRPSLAARDVPEQASALAPLY